MESMDKDRLVAVIRGATQEVFSMMLGLNVESQEASVQEAGSESFDGVISLIGLAGSWVGSGRISCTATLACKLSGALLASEYTAVNEEVLDAMAEVTNMIIGNVKSTLEEELGPMGLSIPTVIFGRNYQARSTGVNEWVVVPFMVEGERLEIKAVLVPNGKAEGQRHFLVQEPV